MYKTTFHNKIFFLLIFKKYFGSDKTFFLRKNTFHKIKQYEDIYLQFSKIENDWYSCHLIYGINHTDLDSWAINKTKNKLMSMGSFHCWQK